MDFKNVKDAMDFLFAINDRYHITQVRYDDEKKWRNETMTELKVSNWEALAYIADLLGMSELYLDRKRINKSE
ncbi:MAG: hypothetical protein SPG62_08490 [Lactobacillus johnsonii]|uniref:hypothetical protein n=1 Tax=Lactobacillus TaxID=1578 RepID=UPI00201A6519|nr:MULTISPECIES: hypothetical protein [Lactobacillus]MCI7714680.1 hypothetical protein [Lactobacillus johnsonii]MCL5444364.1 hypothetical protein [Lactobacillus johnsonii]MDY2640387.1 hypothetical protein [Ligilactobacillus salivarius]MDY5352223.1 hypothetical protein [Lactobacillus johnsonii]